MENAYFYETIIGKIFITENYNGITGLSLIPEEDYLLCEQYNGKYSLQESERIKETAKQLEEYLKGDRQVFDIKIDPQGTDFQKKVWKALQTIPYGETRSYKQIACAIGNDKASRAVGMANHNNPILCIIPCHRVIGADGTLVGFGAGLNIKEKLLRLEMPKKKL